ncbi:MAG: hypothetical protein PHV16_02590 [Candidatus Nanoarchaeia archaeon]|nr:hypothetical protein [Candidatus Nanoarchaeia archaeon]
MKFNYFFLFLVCLLFLVSGCKECEVSSDCSSKARELYSGYSSNCLDIECADNVCEINSISNCCGNKRCEEGAGENKCTCTTDCGKCEGKGEVQIGSRTYESQYLEYGCSEGNECELMIDDSLINQVSLSEDKQLSYFTIEIKSSYDYPFNIDESSFYAEIKLKDTENDLILPVSITNVKIIEGELLIGETSADGTLGYIGSSSKIRIPITFGMKEIEEEKRVSLVIDYMYKINQRIGRNSDGTPIYEEKVVRDSYTKSYGSKLFFVNPD